MSFVGCNFLCQNEDCKCFNTGFSLTGTWPLADIDIMIDKCEDEALKEALKKRKLFGYEYAKINYPDPHETPIVAYSVEKFCQKCKRVQTFDIKSHDDETTPTCETCNEEYITFQVACDVENGLECPFCHDKMQQNRWYVNENEEEEETL